MAVNYHSYSKKVRLIECPRDAMQGWKKIIPTQKKVEYLNSLLKVGFDTLDFGSFVSPVAIPQMADTRRVIDGLKLENSRTKLLAIVANLRGAEQAVEVDQITYIGFPFSISPTFQIKNTNSSMEKSVEVVEQIRNLSTKHNKELVVYLSMGFGNPYSDVYDEEILLHWSDEMVKRGIQIISIADTIGMATPDQIDFALSTLIPSYPQTEFGVHLHTSFDSWQPKLEAALNAGCKRFDGTLRGIGGCPMAKDELIGNLNSEQMIEFFRPRNILPNINEEALEESLRLADEIFEV